MSGHFNVLFYVKEKRERKGGRIKGGRKGNIKEVTEVEREKQV